MPNPFIDLEKYRDGKGYIDLIIAYDAIYHKGLITKHKDIDEYLLCIMRITPIKSRQVAALAIATATLIGEDDA